MQHTLSGIIKKIIFQNKENLYTVAEFLDEVTETIITITGYLAGVKEEDSIKITGRWEKHKKYGQQFAVKLLDHNPPVTSRDIFNYIDSLEVKNLTPNKIKSIVKEFDIDTITILETAPDELLKVKGINKELSEKISEAHIERYEIRHLVNFLQQYNLPLSLSAGLYVQFKDKAIDKIKTNPYIIIRMFPETDFAIIDRAALMIGFSKNSPQRIEAVVLNTIEKFESEGNTYSYYKSIINRSSAVYGIDYDLIPDILEKMHKEFIIVIDNDGAATDNPAVFSEKLYTAEKGIASRLISLSEIQPEDYSLSIEDITETVAKKIAIKLSEQQLEILGEILAHKVSIITGGPGTGKTTLIRSVNAIFNYLKKKTTLTAPTGRAARRLSEVSGAPASTIHKLLKFNFKDGDFEKNRDNQLKTDVLIIDEASMVDTVLMYRILDATPDSASIILVGDIFQLPSISPGNVLADIIRSQKFKTFELTEIFRQARESEIIMNAHRVKEGLHPESTNKKKEELSEFYFIETHEPVKIMERIVFLCSKRIPEIYNFNPMTDIQVLTPMHKGEVGTISLNNKLQQILNPSKKVLEKFGRFFKEGDKVMHLKNNYEKEVFNGDIGIIDSIDIEKKALTIMFYEKKVHYEFEELDELTLAYAISVHKSQGSEYNAVIIPVTTNHYPLLQRNLIYTAITRGKSLVILIGSSNALSIALKNNKPNERRTGLSEKIKHWK